jgi:hypothetical protein
MAVKRITFSAGTSVYLPKAAVITNVIYTGEGSVDSDCLTITNEENLTCFSFVICQANQIREGVNLEIPPLGFNDAANTDNWELVTYQGIIINGEEIPFSAPISINLGNGISSNDTSEAETVFLEGVEDLVTAFSTLTLYTQGLISSVCNGGVTDDNYDNPALSIDNLRGVCASISFKAPESIMTDARLYGYMDSFDSVNMPFQYPIYTDDYVSETIGQPTCGCV